MAVIGGSIGGSEIDKGVDRVRRVTSGTKNA